MSNKQSLDNLKADLAAVREELETAESVVARLNSEAVALEKGIMGWILAARERKGAVSSKLPL